MAKEVIDAEVRLLPEEAARIDYLRGDFDPIETTIYNSADILKGFQQWGLEKLLKSMEKNGVGKAVISGLPFKNKTKAQSSTEYLKYAVSKYPDRFRALYSPRFEDVDEEIAILQELASHGFSGIEIIPKWQGLNFTKSHFSKYFGFIRDNDFVVKLFVPHVYQVDLDGVAYHLLEFCRKNPGIKVVTPHLGGMLFWYQEHPPLKSILSNLGYISSLPTSPNVIKKAQEINEDCLMFGTDYPFNWGFSQESSIKSLKKAGLTADKFAKFYNSNARRFFKF